VYWTQTLLPDLFSFTGRLNIYEYILKPWLWYIQYCVAGVSSITFFLLKENINTNLFQVKGRLILPSCHPIPLMWGSFLIETCDVLFWSRTLQRTVTASQALPGCHCDGAPLCRLGTASAFQKNISLFIFLLYWKVSVMYRLFCNDSFKKVNSSVIICKGEIMQTFFNIFLIFFDDFIQVLKSFYIPVNHFVLYCKATNIKMFRSFF
jgi:hypothetical protein